MLSKMSNISESAMINLLVQEFFNMSTNFHSKEINLSWDNQKLLMDLTVQSPIVCKYPMKTEYCKSFLKKVTACLEKSCEYVHDEVYNAYHIFYVGNANNESFYKHYMVQDDTTSFITLKESSNLIADGTTGLRTWEAAAVLADWALSNKLIFTKKHVLELGSGLGLTGIIVAKQCSPASYCFSDCHPRVLRSLEENILINFPDCHRTEAERGVEFRNPNIKCDLNILMFDWNHATDTTYRTVPDVVIGADIVYDCTIFDVLCNVLKTLCEMNVNIMILIVSTIRNKKTIEEFIQHLDVVGLKMDKLQHPNPKHMSWNLKQEYCILKIYY